MFVQFHPATSKQQASKSERDRRRATYPLYLTHAPRTGCLAGSKQKLVSLQYSLRQAWLASSSERARLLLDRSSSSRARSRAHTYSIYLSHVVVIDADIYACMHARIIPHPHIIFKISRRVHIQRNDKRNIIELAITYMMHVCLLA